MITLVRTYVNTDPGGSILKDAIKKKKKLYRQLMCGICRCAAFNVMSALHNAVRFDSRLLVHDTKWRARVPAAKVRKSHGRWIEMHACDFLSGGHTSVPYHFVLALN